MDGSALISRASFNFFFVAFLAHYAIPVVVGRIASYLHKCDVRWARRIRYHAPLVRRKTAEPQALDWS